MTSLPIRCWCFDFELFRCVACVYCVYSGVSIVCVFLHQNIKRMDLSTMSRRCVVNGCKARSKHGATLFTLNSSDAVRNQWTEILGLDSRKIPSSWRICTEHFAPDAWEAIREDGKKKLKRNARPTLNMALNSENAENNCPITNQSCGGQSPSRLPFGNITNVTQNTQTLNRSASHTPILMKTAACVNNAAESSPAISVKERDVELANILLSLCDASPKSSERVSVLPGNPFINTLSEDPVGSADVQTHNWQLCSFLTADSEQSADATEGSEGAQEEVSVIPGEALSSSWADESVGSADATCNLQSYSFLSVSSTQTANLTEANEGALQQDLSVITDETQIDAVADVLVGSLLPSNADHSYCLSSVNSVETTNDTQASPNARTDFAINAHLNEEEPILNSDGGRHVPKDTKCTKDHLRKLDHAELISIIEKQTRELQEEKKKNQRYGVLLRSLHGRSKQMRLQNATYRTKLKRLADSKISRLVNARSRLKIDQVTSLCRRSARGMKWQTATIRDAIVFKMKMGSKAYSDFVKKVPIYPSERTIQRAVEHMDFESGVLYDVFHAIKEDVSSLPLEQRLCVVGGDEMAIQEAEVYDPGSKKMVGKVTFGPHTGLAKKAFTMVLGGVARRYRVTGAYCFTSSQGPSGKRKKENDSNPVGEAMKTMLLDVITAAETIAGLMCEAYVCDMGPDNLALWRAFNICCTSKGIVRCSIPHPVRPGARFWFLPDTVHLFKNIINCLSNNEVITLPDDLVAAEGLESNEVKLQHIQDLLDYEKSFELKVAYRLKQDNLDCKKTFAKMRVSNPAAVFCKRTEAALRAKAMVEETSIYDATIFFVATVTKWFALVSNRAGKLALRPFKAEKKDDQAQVGDGKSQDEHDQEEHVQNGQGQDGQVQEESQLREEYIEAIEFLKKIIHVFRGMKIGKDKKWKPIQTGMILACTALLEIQEDLLIKRKLLRFLILGRFTQDFIENLFSLLRFRLAIPNALHFKWNLRVVTLAQICLTANNTNYARDTKTDVLLSPDFIAATKKVADARNAVRAVERLTEEATIDVPIVTDEDFSEIDEWEWLVLYNMAGVVLRNMKKMKNIVTCETCFKALLWQEEESHPCSAVLQLMEYKAGALFAVSDLCFRATLKTEITFRRMRESLKDVQNVDVVSFLADKLQYVWIGGNVPACHNITTKYLRRYITMRFQTYGLMRRQQIKEGGRLKFGSKSMAMHSRVE